MEATVRVTTADGTVVQNADIQLEKGKGTIQASRLGAELSTTAIPFTLTVKKNGYSPQKIKIAKLSDPISAAISPPKYVSSDPGTTVSWMPETQRAAINTRLGRMIPSPAIELDQLRGQHRDDPFIASESDLKRWKAEQQSKKGGSDHTKQAKSLFLSGNHYTFNGFRDEMYNPTFGRTFFSATQVDLLNDETSTGWNIFKSKGSPDKVNPNRLGWFAYAEWGLENPVSANSSTAIKYLIGLWSPRQPSISIRANGKRDIILIFMPDTAQSPRDERPYGNNYPYATSLVPSSETSMFQPYAVFSRQFFFSDQFMSYQLLAAETDALLIWPIQPYTHWEDMARLEGVSRLIYECILFEHRHPYMPPGPGIINKSALMQTDGPPAPGGDGKATLDPDAPTPDRDAVLKERPPTQASDALPTTMPDEPDILHFTPPFSTPAIGNVAIGGYSRGIANVKLLVDQSNRLGLQLAQHDKSTANAKIPNQTPTTTNNSYAETDIYSASPIPLITAWKEIWDLDGSQSGGFGSVSTWTSLLHTWQRSALFRHLQRKIRSYHTSFTISSPTEVGSIASSIVGHPLRLIGGRARPINRAVYDKGNEATGAKEWEGPDGTAVWIRKDLIYKNKPAAAQKWDEDTMIPAFWGPWTQPFGESFASHWFVLNVLLAHAASNSVLSNFRRQ